jgi:hypothetical protein
MGRPFILATGTAEHYAAMEESSRVACQIPWQEQANDAGVSETRFQLLQPVVTAHFGSSL